MAFARNEVEEAFRRCWTTGSVEEDWAAWPEHLTEDVHYVEHYFGVMQGRAAVRAWITELMVVRADVHALLEWYVIEGHRVVLRMQNRYYAPDPAGTPFDFPGLTVLEYAGDGLFRSQEDYWDLELSKAAYAGFTAEVERCGGRGLDGGRFEQLEAERKAANHAVFDRHGA